MGTGERGTIRVEVECRQGSTLAPLRFGIGDREIEVAEIVDMWPGVDHHYTKVATTDGDLYILRYDAEEGAWEIAVFEASEAEGLPPIGPTPSIHV